MDCAVVTQTFLFVGSPGLGSGEPEETGAEALPADFEDRLRDGGFGLAEDEEVPVQGFLAAAPMQDLVGLDGGCELPDGCRGTVQTPP